MMKIELIFVCILVSCLMGCRTRYICPKEHSYLVALRILQTTDKQEMRNKIKDCKDVDALRIVAFTTYITAWPMKAGSNIDFDAEMEGIFYVAMGKLFDIGSDAANESIECHKRAFPPDGAESLFFKECEEKRRVLQGKWEWTSFMDEDTIDALSKSIGGPTEIVPVIDRRNARLQPKESL